MSAKILTFSDSFRGLVNQITGLGTKRDKGTVGTWQHQPMAAQQLEAAYRSNWMARKVVDIPALDMLRKGWVWQADEAQVALLEAECARLNLHAKVLQAQKWARLYGGAGIYLSDNSATPDQELSIDSVRRGGLAFAIVLPRQMLTSSEMDLDPMSPWYGHPKMYDLQTASGSVKVHPSRVVRFLGNEVPGGNQQSDVWADSVLEAVEIAIRDCTSGQQGIAHLIQEASIDVIGVENMMSQIMSKEYEDALVTRTRLAMETKSSVNALLIDKNDTYEQKTANFGSLPDVQRLLLQIVSGAADIPATRFVGQSPAGLSATGESDMRNYYDRIDSERELGLRPPLHRIFEFVIRSALGTRPPEIYFTFPSLWQMSEEQQSQIEERRAKTIQSYAVSGVLPETVLAEMAKGALTESGAWPGIERAYLEQEALAPAPGAPEPDDPSALIDPPAKPAAVTDAAPRTLYVSRNVINTSDILKWAKSQGFKSLEKAAHLHVTVARSSTPLDWMAIDPDWASEKDGKLIVPAGGPRLVEALGDKGAVVLFFASSPLTWRHESIKRAGASWDFDSFQPHVTFTYKPGTIDLKAVEPYRGEIILGPEIFAEVNEDWLGTR